MKSTTQLLEAHSYNFQGQNLVHSKLDRMRGVVEFAANLVLPTMKVNVTSFVHKVYVTILKTRPSLLKQNIVCYGPPSTILFLIVLEVNSYQRFVLVM